MTTEAEKLARQALKDPEVAKRQLGFVEQRRMRKRSLSVENQILLTVPLPWLARLWRR